MSWKTRMFNQDCWIKCFCAAKKCERIFRGCRWQIGFELSSECITLELAGPPHPSPHKQMFSLIWIYQWLMGKFFPENSQESPMRHLCLLTAGEGLGWGPEAFVFIIFFAPTKALLRREDCMLAHSSKGYSPQCLKGIGGGCQGGWFHCSSSQYQRGRWY